MFKLCYLPLAESGIPIGLNFTLFYTYSKIVFDNRSRNVLVWITTVKDYTHNNFWRFTESSDAGDGMGERKLYYVRKNSIQ